MIVYLKYILSYIVQFGFRLFIMSYYSQTTIRPLVSIGINPVLGVISK